MGNSIATEMPNAAYRAAFDFHCLRLRRAKERASSQRETGSPMRGLRKSRSNGENMAELEWNNSTPNAS